MTTNSMKDIPAAACRLCGGWTSSGGMSQHARSITKVMGRTGCQCNGCGIKHKTIDIPLFSIRLRDPVTGWQVVDVAHTEASARAKFKHWCKAAENTVSVTLVKAHPTVPQCWSMLDENAAS